jgi:hypothetical protein
MALALIVMGALIFLDRMGAGYGLRQGWPWIIIALGIGGLLRSTRSIASWITTVVGVLILCSRYYSINFSIPILVRTYFLPVLLIVMGLLWLWRSNRDG